MKISEDIKGAVSGFIIDLCKGLMEDERWDWDLEECDWEYYKKCFADPGILRTTIAVFMNNLEIDENGTVSNYEDASFRGFQYFRRCCDKNYELNNFTDWELEEPDWQVW